jgi:TonB family protein
LSFNIEIATTPADLEALGLEKKSGDTQRTGVEGPVHGDQETFLADFLMPGYPSLARTSGVQGEVKVAVELDSKCQVSTSQILAGHPLLNSTVLEAIQGWHFTSCAAGGGKVDVVFHFVLVEPDVPARDDWAPTHLEMTGPYEFRIKTMVPPDPTIYG